MDRDCLEKITGTKCTCAKDRDYLAKIRLCKMLRGAADEKDDQNIFLCLQYFRNSEVRSSSSETVSRKVAGKLARMSSRRDSKIGRDITQPLVASVCESKYSQKQNHRWM